MARIVIAEDSAYDLFDRYGNIFGTHDIFVCCALMGEFDKFDGRWPDRPDGLELSLGVPNIGTIRQIQPDLVFADGLGGRGKDVLEAAATFFNTKERAYLWTTNGALNKWAENQNYPIVTDSAHLVRIIDGTSPFSTTLP